VSSFLVIVERAQRMGSLLQVLPRIPLKELIAREPGIMMPMPGDGLWLRFPDGSNRTAVLGLFGVEAWQTDGGLLTSSDPQDPVLTLSIAGDLRPEDVPPGTQVWLTDPQYQR
jgi:hypothetical protein